MLTYLMVSVACGSLAGVLTAILYRRYLHRCDTSPDAGPELRSLVKGWRDVATHHASEMGKHAEGTSLYYEHRAYGLTYESCARHLEALVERAEAGRVTARPVGGERGLREPVRRIGGGASAGVVAAGAVVLRDEIDVEVRRWPEAGAGPS